MTNLHAAELTIRSVDMFTDALAYMNLAGQIDRVTVTFKDLKTLYHFVRSMQLGIRDLYRPPNNDPSEFKRDEGGLIYSDWTLLGVNYRFTTLERTTGYDISPVFEPMTTDPTVGAALVDYGIDEERRRHP